MQKLRKANAASLAANHPTSKDIERVIKAAKSGRRLLRRTSVRYKSAKELNITSSERKWLIKTANFLSTMSPEEHREIHGVKTGFSLSTYYLDLSMMPSWLDREEVAPRAATDCGSVACIRGWCGVLAVAAGKGEELGLSITSNSIKKATGLDITHEVRGEFSEALNELFEPNVHYDKVTPKIAAKVTQRFLKTGKIVWPKSVRPNC